jgi:hypothetical protein
MSKQSAGIISIGSVRLLLTSEKQNGQQILCKVDIKPQLLEIEEGKELASLLVKITLFSLMKS